jgi:hypothetical protein
LVTFIGVIKRIPTAANAAKNTHLNIPPKICIRQKKKGRIIAEEVTGRPRK